VALVTLGLAAVRVMPKGTFVARRGFPAVVAVRGLGGAAFAGVGAYLPLLLTLQHDFSPSRAGVTLSITGVCWAFGSWLQGREHGIQRVNVLRTGRLKYVHFTALPPLLFDLERDPDELVDRADDPAYREDRLALTARMLSWRMEHDERVLTGMHFTRNGVFERRRVR